MELKKQLLHHSRRQSSRLRGTKRLSGGTKFEIKHKSRCLGKRKLVNWEAKLPCPPPPGAGPKLHYNSCENEACTT